MALTLFDVENSIEQKQKMPLTSFVVLLWLYKGFIL